MRRRLKKNLIYSGFIIAALTLTLGYSVAYYTSSEIITLTVKDKERITTGSGENISSKFIIYAEGEVFENTDSWLYAKFNSADIQNKLSVGETYKVEVAGWRVPFLSMYRNVIIEK